MEGMRVSERELRICIAGEQARAQGSQRLLNCPDIHLCPLAISSSVWTSSLAGRHGRGPGDHDEKMSKLKCYLVGKLLLCY